MKTTNTGNEIIKYKKSKVGTKGVISLVSTFIYMLEIKMKCGSNINYRRVFIKKCL